MVFRKFCIVIIQILLSISAFSQVDSTFKDTLKEIIVFEYDTVYIEPDTIRITDTITTIIKTTEVKKKKEYSLAFLNPKSIGFNLLPFFSGNLKNKNISDSLSYQTVINSSLSVQLNYYNKKYFFSIGLGFTPFHEKYQYTGTYYSVDGITDTTGTYDSLLINKEYTGDYYYQYLNLNILFGKKWNLNKRWNLRLVAGFTSDFLLGYKQGNTKTMRSEIRKFDISIAFSPQIVYTYKKRKQNFEIYISPFYQHSLLANNKYPYTTLQKMGIGVGFNKILKKR
jgi:hypothetical protein